MTWISSFPVSCRFIVDRRHYSDEFAKIVDRDKNRRLRRKGDDISQKKCLKFFLKSSSSRFCSDNCLLEGFLLGNWRTWLIEKMKGLQQKIVSPYGGDFISIVVNSFDVSSRPYNGKKVEIRAIHVQRDGKWCQKKSRWVTSFPYSSGQRHLHYSFHFAFSNFIKQ